MDFFKRSIQKIVKTSKILPLKIINFICNLIKVSNIQNIEVNYLNSHNMFVFLFQKL